MAHMRPPLRTTVLFALLLSLAATLRAEKPFSFSDTPGQLPKTIAPRHYSLRIQADLEARTTIGTEEIDFEVLQPTREIILNALELDIASTELLRRTGDDKAADEAQRQADALRRGPQVDVGRPHTSPKR